MRHSSTSASIAFLLVLLMLPCAAAGPFDNVAISPADIRAWANEVITFEPTPSGSAAGLESNALGRADEVLVSLGDLDAAEIAQQNSPGSITLSLPFAITDGPGWDFAVFENAGNFFTEPFWFAELAYVEVSSNGTDFERFPSTSLNVEPGAGTADTEIEAGFGRDFAGVNITNISNLAGIHPAGSGTGFDLADLAGTSVDVNNIEYVRIIDIPGDGTFLDAAGNGILDAWPGGAENGGFDLDAVGARHLTPEPNSSSLFFIAIVACGLLRRRQ